MIQTALILTLILSLWVCPALAGLEPELIERIVRDHRLDPSRAEETRKKLIGLPYITQGVAPVTQHPISRERCQAEALAAGKLYQPPAGICANRPHMVPIDGKVCIDQFEFPGIPCEYPVTWVSGREAQGICRAMGKRLCDAAEWEGACAGALAPVHYTLDRHNHNIRRQLVWAYGSQRRGDLCAFGGQKSPACAQALSQPGGQVRASCGSNTWPAGWFHRCVSPIGAYDLHGNAAEHMNLPFNPAQSTRIGASGVTEMKGSWFGFSTAQTANVHPDDCHWRAPAWHRSALLDPQGHANYHLGFRCCANAD